MDLLNTYMQDQKLPPRERVEMREFFTLSREIHRTHFYKDLLTMMSPRLRGIVSMHCNQASAAGSYSRN